MISGDIERGVSLAWYASFLCTKIWMIIAVGCGIICHDSECEICTGEIDLYNTMR